MPYNIPTYNGKTVIKHNKIEGTLRTNPNATVTSYGYDNHIRTYASAVIESNTLSKPNSSANMIELNKASCIIKNNTLIRNTTNINTYINRIPVVASTNPVNHLYNTYYGVDEITDNIFDNTTTDGYIEVLVSGLTPGSIYTRNKNQSGFVYIPLFGNDIGDTIGGFSGTLFNNFVSTAGDGFFYASLKSNLTTSFSDLSGVDNPDNCFITRAFDLNNYLDSGAQVIKLKVGGYVTSGNITDFGFAQRFIAILRAYDSSGMNAVSLGPDPIGFLKWEHDLNNSDDVTNLKATTQYTDDFISGSSLPVGFDGDGFTGPTGNFYGFHQQDLFRVGNGYQIKIEFRANLLFTSSSWGITFTPIEVKYIW